MELVSLYTKKLDEELIIWSDDPGFSVIRKYPNDSGFIAVKTPAGEDDTRILIKVGYPKHLLQDDAVVLYVSGSKYERYLAGRFRYDFEDENSPTKASVDTSNSSLQPHTLEENSRYVFHPSTGLISDLEKKRDISVEEVVEDMYKLHIQTIRGLRSLALKGKLSIQSLLCGKIVPGAERALKAINKHCLGKQLIENPNDWSEGLFTPYSVERLQTIYPNAIPFFHSDAQISKAAVFLVALTITFGFYLLPSTLKPDTTTSLAVVVLLVFFYDIFIPHLIFRTVNMLIRFRRWFARKPIRF